jgi:hypothetical protein
MTTFAYINRPLKKTTKAILWITIHVFKGRKTKNLGGDSQNFLSKFVRFFCNLRAVVLNRGASEP